MKEKKDNFAIAILRREFDNADTHTLEELNQVGDAIDKLQEPSGEVMAEGKCLWLEFMDKSKGVRSKILGDKELKDITKKIETYIQPGEVYKLIIHKCKESNNDRE